MEIWDNLAGRMVQSPEFNVEEFGGLSCDSSVTGTWLVWIDYLNYFYFYVHGFQSLLQANGHDISIYLIYCSFARDRDLVMNNSPLWSLPTPT